MAKTYTILGLAVAIILGVYFVIPQKRFEENVFPLIQGEDVLVYDDQTDGGNSQIESSVDSSALNFSCTLGADTSKGAWCGIVFSLSDVKKENFRKWNFVDSVILDIEAYGTSEILLKIWTFDSDITKLDEWQSFRLLLKEVPLSDGRQRIAVAMDDFYTPDFWTEKYGKESSGGRRFLETTARLEITSGWNQPRGKRYSLNIRDISVSGVSNLYFGLAMIAIILVVVAAIGLRHPKSEDK